MSHIAVEGPGGTLGAPTPSTVRHGTASCGLLVLSQEGMPALTHSTVLATGQRDRLVAAEGFALLCVCVCVRGCGCDVLHIQ